MRPESCRSSDGRLGDQVSGSLKFDSFSESSDLGHLDAEGIRQPLHGRPARGLRAALYSRDPGRVMAGPISEILLRQLLSKPDLFDR